MEPRRAGCGGIPLSSAIFSVTKSRMYQTGNVGDFQVRLHRATGQADLDLYYIEGHNTGYTGVVPYYQIKRWNREYVLKQYQFTNSGQFLSGQPFSY